MKTTSTAAITRAARERLDPAVSVKAATGRGEIQSSHSSLEMQRVLGWSWLATAFCTGVHAQWTQRWDPSMAAATAQPARRAAHAMVAFEDHVYVYGGIGIDRQGDDQEFADTWAFDLENQTWSSVASANASAGPGTRFHLSGALHSNDSVGEFIIFGGVSISAATSSPVATSTGTTTIPVQQYNDVWRLSLTGQPDNSTEWVQDQVMTTDAPESRSEAGLAVFNNQLVVFGGISYDSMGVNAPVDHNDLWTYSLSDCTWTKVTPAEGSSVPPSRFSHSISMIELGGTSYLLVFSGRHLQRSGWSVLDDMWLFDFTSSKWIAVKPSAQVQRAYTSVVTIDDSMWFFGGYYRPPQGTSGFVFDDVVRGKVSVEGATATSSSSTASMDVEYGVVTSATPPLRYSHRAVLWKSCMVVFGGSYQSPRGDLWVYNTTNAATKVPLTARLPMNVETLVYVLGCFILAIILALVALVVRWRRLDRQNVRSAVSELWASLETHHSVCSL